jgi:hypothetical protein
LRYQPVTTGFLFRRLGCDERHRRFSSASGLVADTAIIFFPKVDYLNRRMNVIVHAEENAKAVWVRQSGGTNSLLLGRGLFSDDGSGLGPLQRFHERYDRRVAALWAMAGRGTG